MDWYPFYPALYRADTMHLTAEQDGIYRRLIDHYMETGHPLPDNDSALARISGVSVECFMHASSIVRAFFKHKSDGFLYHKRCESELHQQQSRKKSRSEIAKKAAEKRWDKQQVVCIEHAPSMHQAMLFDATRQDKTKEKTIKKEMDVHFDKFWTGFPKQRRGDREKAFSAWKLALTKATPEEILAGSATYAQSDEVARGFAKGAAAWLNDSRWTNDYKPTQSVAVKSMKNKVVL